MGDDFAAEFDTFYAARASPLVRSIYLRTGDTQRAEDSVQEAFVRAWMRWPHVRDHNPTAWVRTVAWRLAVTDWRSATRQQLARRNAQILSHDRDLLVDEVLTIRAALSRLGGDQQTALVLYYFEDLSVADVAQFMGAPPSTVKSHLHRGRAALRTMIDESASTLNGPSGSNSFREQE